MLSSYIYVNNVDISSVFQPWTSGSTLTRIYIQGAELGTKFQAYSSGANAAATRIYVGPSDLNTIFQKYSSAPSPSLYNINNSNLVRYYPFDTNLSDYVTGSAVSNVTSIGGAAVVTTNTKLTSGSLYINATSSQGVQIPNITIAAGGFTFACWIKYISSIAYARIFDFGTGTNINIVCMYQANMSSLLKIGLYLTNTSSGTGGVFDTGFTLPDANWHHVCATVSSAGLWTVYIDGVSNVTSVTAYPSATTLTRCYIGKSNNANDIYPTFYMNQVLIFNRALTSAEIGVIYSYPNQLTFTSQPSYTGLEFYLASFTSSSLTSSSKDAFNNTLTNINNDAITNGSIVTFNDPTRGYVLSCKAPVGADGVTYTSISTNYPTPASFTRCFWVYVIKLGNFSAVDFVCSYNVPIFIVGNIVKVSFQNNNGADQNTLSFNNGATFVGKWTHFAVTNNRTNTSTNAGTATLYINGVNKATYSSTFAGDGSGLNTGGGLTIGDWYNARTVGSNAYYDSIRCYNRALTAAEVLQIYNSETATTTTTITTGSITGWSISSTAITTTSSLGNPAPCIYVPGGTYGFINLATIVSGLTTFKNHKFTFDIYCAAGSLINVYFGCNSAGDGQLWRLETRGSFNSGIARASSWTNFTQPSVGSALNGNTWYTVVITISSAGVATYTYNGLDGFGQSYTIADNGTYIGISGDGLAGGYVDNILFL